MALSAYRDDIGRYPNEPEGLGVLRHAQPHIVNWQGPYYPKEIPNDPWGRPYLYRLKPGNNDAVQVGTLGADGKPGGSGDDEDFFVELTR